MSELPNQPHPIVLTKEEHSHKLKEDPKKATLEGRAVVSGPFGAETTEISNEQKAVPKPVLKEQMSTTLTETLDQLYGKGDWDGVEFDDDDWYFFPR